MADLTADDEVLFRQIHPDLIDQGEPSSSNFCPNPKSHNLPHTL